MTWDEIWRTLGVSLPALAGALLGYAAKWLEGWGADRRSRSKELRDGGLKRAEQMLTQLEALQASTRGQGVEDKEFPAYKMDEALLVPLLRNARLLPDRHLRTVLVDALEPFRASWAMRQEEGKMPIRFAQLLSLQGCQMALSSYLTDEPVSDKDAERALSLHKRLGFDLIVGVSRESPTGTVMRFSGPLLRRRRGGTR